MNAVAEKPKIDPAEKLIFYLSSDRRQKKEMTRLEAARANIARRKAGQRGAWVYSF